MTQAPRCAERWAPAHAARREGGRAQAARCSLEPVGPFRPDRRPALHPPAARLGAAPPARATLSAPSSAASAPPAPPSPAGADHWLLNPWAAGSLGIAAASELAGVMEDACIGEFARAVFAGEWPAAACLGMAAGLILPQLAAPHREAMTQRWRALGERTAPGSEDDAPLSARRAMTRAVLHGIDLAADGSEHLCVWATRLGLMGATQRAEVAMGTLLLLAAGAATLHGAELAASELAPLARWVVDGTREAARLQELAVLRQAAEHLDLGFSVLPVALGVFSTLTEHVAREAQPLPEAIDQAEEVFKLLRLALWLPLAVRQFAALQSARAARE